MYRRVERRSYQGSYDKIDYDKEFEYPGMREYIDEAKQLMLEYNRNLAQLMNQREIKYEVSVISQYSIDRLFELYLSYYL